MKVIVGDRVFDSDDIPIIVIFPQRDKKFIECLNDGEIAYASFPKDFGTLEQMNSYLRLRVGKDELSL